MSGYSGGRKAPNVSQYLANLNSIPSPTEASLNNDGFGLDDDMNLFTNTEFLDFDIPDLANGDFGAAKRQRTSSQTVAVDAQVPTDAFMPGNFKFADYEIDPRFQTDIKSAGMQLGPQAQSVSTSSPSTSSPAAQHRPSTGDKRPLEYMTGAGSVSSAVDPAGEEVARLAAEEDKRRRNTAASARFRVKKKQREQALEKTAKEMTEKVGVLEAKVQQLEMENKWLKGLIMEKNDAGDLGEMWRQFSTGSSSQGGRALDKLRNGEERKDGVGTA